MKTDRLTIYKKIDEKEFLTEPDTPHTIDYLITWLTEMKEKGATVLNWSVNVWDNDVNEIDCAAYVAEPESDEQYNARIEKQKKQRADHLQYVEMLEKQQYEKLKAKFEK